MLNQLSHTIFKCNHVRGRQIWKFQQENEVDSGDFGVRMKKDNGEGSGFVPWMGKRGNFVPWTGKRTWPHPHSMVYIRHLFWN